MSSPSLYERLGGSAGIKTAVTMIIDEHIKNPFIGKRFELLRTDPARRARIEQGTRMFIEQGTGGPGVYAGADMAKVHKGMNLSGDEFLSAVDDVFTVLTKLGADDQTKKDVLFIFYSLKDEVLKK